MRTRSAKPVECVPSVSNDVGDGTTVKVSGDCQASASVAAEQQEILLNTVIIEKASESVETIETVPGVSVSNAEVPSPSVDSVVCSGPVDINHPEATSPSEASKNDEEVPSQTEVSAGISQENVKEFAAPSPSSFPQPFSVTLLADLPVPDQSSAPESTAPTVPSAQQPLPPLSSSSIPQPVPPPVGSFTEGLQQPIQPPQHPPPHMYGPPIAPGYGPPPLFKSQGYPPILNLALMTSISTNPPPVQNAGEPVDIHYMVAGVRAQHEADLDPFERFKANFIGENSRLVGDAKEPQVRLVMDMDVQLMNKIVQRFENSCKKSKIQKTPAAILNEITIGICPINFSAQTTGTFHQPVHNAVMTIPILGEFKIASQGTKQEVKHKISSHICTLLHKLRQDFRQANFQVGNAHGQSGRRNQGGQQQYPPIQPNQYQQPNQQPYQPNQYPPPPYPPYSQSYPPSCPPYQQAQFPPSQQYQQYPPQNPPNAQQCFQLQPYQQTKNSVSSPSNGVKRIRFEEEMETDDGNDVGLNHKRVVDNESMDYESTVPEEFILDPVKASAIYNAITQQSDQYLTPIMLEKLFSHFDAHQQHQLKQQELHRFQEIAGFVLENTITNTFKTLTFATGTKCVFAEYLSLEGDTLFDCHAEVLARRALKALLTEQISLILANGLKDKDEFILVLNGESFELKSHLKIHLYISSPPCGDSRMFNFNERKRTERNSVSRGLLRHKVEKGQGTIPTNIKYISCWDAYLASEDRVRVMSCSDKVAMWNFMGVQGALLSNFLKPIYIESLVVTYLFRPQPLCRALFGRVPKDMNCEECPQYKINHHKVARSHRDSSMQDKSSVFSNPPSVSHIWADFKSEDNSIELIKADTGKQLLDSEESRYCKFGMSARFLRLIYEYPNKIPSAEFDSNELKDLYSRPDTNKFMKSYNYLKNLAKTYQKAKAGFIFGLHKAQLGDWNKFSCDVNLFEIC